MKKIGIAFIITFFLAGYRKEAEVLLKANQSFT